MRLERSEQIRLEVDEAKMDRVTSRSNGDSRVVSRHRNQHSDHMSSFYRRILGRMLDDTLVDNNPSHMDSNHTTRETADSCVTNTMEQDRMTLTPHCLVDYLPTSSES